MKWLINTVIEQVDFSPEIELLVTLQKLRSRGISLRDVFTSLLSTGEPGNLEEYQELNQNEKKEVKTLLSSLPDLLKAAFGHDVNDYPEELKFLGQAFAGLGDEPVECSWQLISRSTATERNAIEGLLFKLSGGVASGVRIQANPPLPEGIPDSILEPANLSLTFQGSIHAGAKSESQNSPMSLRLGAKIAATADLSYYFGHSSDTIVANALLTNLHRLTSPFDVKEIYSGIQDGQHLNAVRLTAQGSISFDGQIGFSNAVSLSQGGAVTAGVDAWVAFELAESGQFDYLITKAPDAPHLHVRVSRTRTSSSQITEGISVGIDMTKWAERVYPEVRDHLSTAGELLEEVKSYLPGSETLRNSLESALDRAIDDSRYKDEIKRALGFSTGERIDTIILNKLLPQVETSASLWQADASRAARNVTAELFDRLDLGTEIENRLQIKLEQQLESAFDEVRAKLKAEVTKFIEKSPADKLEKKLKDIGSEVQARINSAADKAAELTSFVREQLDLVQQRLARLKQPFEDASKAKILFKYEALRRDEDGRSLDIKFTLDPTHSDAQEVLTEILSARLGPYLARKRNGAILNISGNYKRYKTIVESDRFNVVLFGLGFNGSTETRISSLVNVDPQGNIQVISKQEWEKRYGRSVDVRRLTFANAREINASTDFQDMTVNFSLSMEDKELEADELSSFLLPFEQQGLLRTGVTANALSHIGSSRPGHVELGLALTTDQLDRMILKAEESKGEEVLRIGAEIFEALVLRQPPNITFRDLLPVFLKELSQETGSDLRTVSKAIQGWSREIMQDATRVSTRTDDDRLTSIRLEELITWLDARHTALVGKESYCGSWNSDDGALPGREECLAMVEARPGMVQFLTAIASIRRRELDVEDLDNETQLLDALNESQMAMNIALRNWHSHGQDVAKWWLYQDREPRLFSMALFLLLARLSQRNRSSTLPMLSAAITFTNPNKDRIRIPLT